MARAKRPIGKVPISTRRSLILTVNDLIRDGNSVGVAVGIVAANTGLSEAAINKYRRQYRETEPPGALMKQRLAGYDTMPRPEHKQFMSSRSRRRKDISPTVLEWLVNERRDFPDLSVSSLHRAMIREFHMHNTYLPSIKTLHRMVSEDNVNG